MNGAESLVATLLKCGIDTCFTNPGTSEMHLVAALDKQPNMRCVLGLFEGVVTGAADGYARMAEKPACTLLHLGPGLANGLANLHNASRAQVPILNIVGQHASYHLRHNAPLTSDIEGIARPFSSWVRTSCSGSEIPIDVIDGIIAARTLPGQIATLIVPADAAWGQGGVVRSLPRLVSPPIPANETVELAASMLRSGARTALLLAGEALYGRGLTLAGQIASSTNSKLFAPYPFRRVERGAGRPVVERIPYVLEQAVERLKEFQQLILVGAAAPVSYFAAPEKNSVPTSHDCEIHTLATPGEDYAGALDALARVLPPQEKRGQSEGLNRHAAPSGPITLAGLAAAVAAWLPENAIVVDESMTSGHGMMAATMDCPPHDWLANTGGSIGIAMPMAVGAAVACPNRRVLCLSADGSGMYTAQALWTMAREGLKVTTVIFANHVYGVLKREFSYLGVGTPGPRALDLFEIGRPEIDWVSMAKAMGVPGTRVGTLESFGGALARGFVSEGPNLIEVSL
jgi:acetolactate synthase I/II/III large subunit